MEVDRASAAQIFKEKDRRPLRNYTMMKTTRPCFIVPTAWTGSSATSPSSSTTRVSRIKNEREGHHRVMISPATNNRFRRYVSKRMRGPSSPTKLSAIVLDTYLAHMEKCYFGRAKVLACAQLSETKRDKDAIIFDMDGVLCNSEEASRLVGVAVFRELYKTDVKVEDFSQFTGTGEANFLNGVADMYNVKEFDVERGKKEFFDIYMNGPYTENICAFSGIPSLIERIKKLGLKVGVASAADKIKVDCNLNAIGLPPSTFDFVTCSDDIVNKKPAPDVFLKAAQGLGVSADRCTVIEDAAAGVEGAIRAGMRCVGVATSLNSELLIEAGAHVVRDEPAFIELRDLFDADVFQ